MTTYARKIAEAVRDAAVNACEKTEDRYAEENRFKVPELKESAETGARDCEHAVKTLDLDAIIAGVPAPEALKLAVGFLNLHGHEGDAKKVIAEWRSEQPQAAESKALVLERDLLKFQVERIKEVATSIHNFAHDKSTGPAVPDALWEVRSMAAQIINDECLTADISTEQCDALTQPQAVERGAKFECAARKQGTAGGNDPAECDWPMCGCDEHATRVIEALQECGHMRDIGEPQAPEPKGLTDERRIGTAAIKDGRVCSYTFEQTDIPDGSYWLYTTMQPSQLAASEAARDAKDAARYRWMRSRGGFLSLAHNQSPEDFDAAIDTMIERLDRRIRAFRYRRW